MNYENAINRQINRPFLTLSPHDHRFHPPPNLAHAVCRADHKTKAVSPPNQAERPLPPLFAYYAHAEDQGAMSAREFLVATRATHMKTLKEILYRELTKLVRWLEDVPPAPGSEYHNFYRP